MKTKVYFVLAMFALLTLLGCAKEAMLPDMTARDLTPDYQAGKTTSKVDNFLVVLDTSLSMEDRDGEYVKFDLAKSFIHRMNQTLPPLKVNGGLRTFGHDPSVARTFTFLPYGMSPYQRAELAKGLDTITVPGGNSPMLEAITAASADLSAQTGKSALIIISDGKDILNQPVAVLESLKQSMGDRLCVYTVLVGNDPKGAALMNNLAAVTPCGFATTARQVATADQMAGFVQKVFLEADADSDGDGVPDRLDKCPNTPRGTKVDKDGCPVKVAVVDGDSDGDGVPDRLDRCPGTPMGAKVNAVGCWVLADVQFHVNKAEIKTGMMGGLKEALAVLNQNPSLRIEVQGHTDSDGAAAYNQQLSEQRAQAVLNYFVQNGIAATRVTAKGYGESMPVADNTTASGKAQNRRVELNPLQ